MIAPLPSWTDEMASVFEDMRASSEFGATLVYLVAQKRFEIRGVKMALSLGFTMQLSGYARKADTSFDMLRSDAVASGLYALCAKSDPQAKRPSVTVENEPFIVLDLKDDNTSDPTVKLILSAQQ